MSNPQGIFLLKLERNKNLTGKYTKESVKYE